ncbi:MAG: AraC family transcriptional regulator [Sphingopyxis sp.]
MAQHSTEALAIPRFGQRIFSTHEFDQARNYVAAFSQPYALTSRRPRSALAFTHRQRRLERIIFDRITVDIDAFQVAAPGIADRFLLQLNFGGECQVTQNDSSYISRAGSMFVINPDMPSRKTWNGGCRQLMVWISRTALYDVLQRELGCNLDKPLLFEWPGRAHEQKVEALWQQILATVSLFDSGAAPALHWRALRQIERWLMVALLTTLPNSYSEDLDRGDNMVAPHYVRRVERFLRENYAEPIEMKDIHQAAGVSPRTLFYGFRQFRNITPMAYLKQLRLQNARRALLDAATQGGSVTEIATGCGLMNLSAFSREYKALFGESPSDTLRRGVS